MIIRMIKAGRGATDGIFVREYLEGETYQVGTALLSFELAEAFIDSGIARIEKQFVGPTELKIETVEEEIDTTTEDNSSRRGRPKKSE